MSQQNLEVVRRLYAALGQRDLDTMNALSHQHVR
jgi:ketosteroid isomerase-like protein